MYEVLNHDQVNKKITRMAYEIYEKNLKAKGVVFAGVSGMGKVLAKLLADKLSSISPLSIEEMEVILDKSNVKTTSISLSNEIDFEGKTIILIDDVLNTGKTLAYAMYPFLDTKVAKLEIAVLVNRSHGLYPLKPDYTGYELSTTLNEHIKVDFAQDQYSVHLL